MADNLPPLLLLGGGTMGSALLAGWRERGISTVVVLDPNPKSASLASDSITVVAAPDAIPPGFAPSAIILAVKPQIAALAVPPLARYAPHSLFISIMAGKTLNWLADHLGDTAGLIRAMPNTPASIRQGVTVACAGQHVTLPQLALAETLLAAVGSVNFVADEALLDPVTAISGGGPAYLFLLVELLEQAAIGHDIPPALARHLARQTIIGAAGLLAASSAPPAKLRQAVTSPNGTTEQALAILMQPDSWPNSISRAVTAATERSRILGQE